MNHAALSLGSPMQLLSLYEFPMASLLPSDTPVELSPSLGMPCKGTATQAEEAGDWGLDQFLLPFPTPDLTSDDQPTTEGSAFTTNTAQSSGYTKRQHVDSNDTIPSPPQPPPKGNNQASQRTRHQIAAAWWRGITAKRIAKANAPELRAAKNSSPVPISPVPSPTIQSLNPPSTLVHTLSLASSTTEPSTTPQSQVLPLLQPQIPPSTDQVDFKQIPVQSPFQLSQYPYQPQLAADLQPFFFHPFQYMYAPMMPQFRSNTDIFGPGSGPKTDSSANWGTSKMGALSSDSASKSLDSMCTNFVPLPTACTTPHTGYPTFSSAPYALAMPPFEYTTPGTHNTYYITNVNNSTFCSNNTYTSTPISPSPTPSTTPTPMAATTFNPLHYSTPPPPTPSPLSSPVQSTESPTTPTANHTTNYNFTYNTTYKCYDNNVTANDTQESECDFGADMNSSESDGNFEDRMDACVTKCESPMAPEHPVEASEKSENEVDQMEEDEEAEERNDSDSDYEDEERHSHKINISIIYFDMHNNTDASRPPVVSVRTTMNTRKRNVESDTVIKTTHTVHTEVRSRKNKQPDSPSSPNSKESNDVKDKSKGWKWHEYNAQEPKKRRTTSNFSFTSSPCTKI